MRQKNKVLYFTNIKNIKIIIFFMSKKDINKKHLLFEKKISLTSVLLQKGNTNNQTNNHPTHKQHQRVRPNTLNLAIHRSLLARNSHN